MTNKKKKFSPALAALLCIASIVVGCLVGFVGMGAYDSYSYHSDKAPSAIVDGEMQIHFLELGNKYTGDCTYIKVGDTDVLIDAGSKTSSAAVISEYLDQYVTDGILEYVIVTHSHEDHYAGFALRDGSIFDRYECKTVIDFAQTNQVATKNGKNTMYGNYKAELTDEIAAGAVHYTAKECIETEKTDFDLGSGVTMKILDNYFYYHTSATENNHSVCTLFTYGDHNYLFTGDLEKEGEEKLVDLNPGLPKVDLYKAGHHGSKTSSSTKLLDVIQPEIVCVCCCCGSPEYTQVDQNQFPTQEFVDRIAPYTDRVYCTSMCVDYAAGKFTSMNGTIVVSTSADGVKVTCSNKDTVLKDWPWFVQHRKCPDPWKS